MGHRQQTRNISEQQTSNIHCLVSHSQAHKCATPINETDMCVCVYIYLYLYIHTHIKDTNSKER